MTDENEIKTQKLPASCCYVFWYGWPARLSIPHAGAGFTFRFAASAKVLGRVEPAPTGRWRDMVWGWDLKQGAWAFTEVGTPVVCRMRWAEEPAPDLPRPRRGDALLIGMTCGTTPGGIDWDPAMYNLAMQDEVSLFQHRVLRLWDQRLTRQRGPDNQFNVLDTRRGHDRLDG